ncbi:MAG: acyltransferase [Planctomycetes bacterium]|nr:acyltransferase [Planctomycetota bacterium]
MQPTLTSEAAPAAGHRAHILPLDGLRGIAILMVMFFHQADLLTKSTQEHGGPLLDLVYARICRAGWVGVDLFFVLSGFLITGILLDTKSRARYFRNFYIRRTLRIFPLYYAVLLALVVILPMLPHSGSGPLAHAITEYAEVRPHQWWFWTYMSNFYFALHGWMGHAIPDVLWSLAIEEQFYLVWPLLVLWIAREHLAKACLAIIAGSLIFRCVLVGYGVDPIAIYVLTPSRLDALATGGLLAAVIRSEGGFATIFKPASWVLAIAGVALVGLFIYRGHLSEYDVLMQTGGLTVIALFFGALLVRAVGAGAGSRTNRFFTCHILRMFGKYAYALYLFHLSVQSVIKVFFRPDRLPQIAGSEMLGQVAFQLLTTAATLALAIASWHLFEKHFLKLKYRLAPE